VQGFFKTNENGVVVLSNLTDDGEHEGELFLKIEDITSISCDDEEANKLKNLNDDLTR
jgi:hypothetical protein